jgi:hypothetical protein
VYCPDRFDESEESALILSCTYDDGAYGEEELRRANECRRILLAAGADPTDESDTTHSAFSKAFMSARHMVSRTDKLS